MCGEGGDESTLCLECSSFARPSVFPPLFQVKNLTLKNEQEIQKRNLTQNDLKVQNQQLNTMRTSEKQLKQENNHLLDIKRSLEKQNQELRKSVFFIYSLLAH